MWPIPSNVGYVLYPNQDALLASLGHRFTSTLYDVLFVPYVSGPIHEVAFWVRYVVGNPVMDTYYFELYEDNGNHVSPGVPLEVATGFTGPIPPSGRVAFTGGFSYPLQRGVRYRLRMRNTLPVGNNYPELLYRPVPLSTMSYGTTQSTGDYILVFWNNAWEFHHRYNAQIVQLVDGQQEVREVLCGLDGSGLEPPVFRVYTQSNSPVGVRVTMPSGPNLLYAGFVISRLFFDAARPDAYRWRVVDDSGRTVAYTMPNRIMRHAGSGGFGCHLERFYEPVPLYAGATYDFIFESSANFTVNAAVISTVKPAWAERYRLLAGGGAVNDAMWPIFYLLVEDVSPLAPPRPMGAGMTNPYVFLPSL